MKRMLRYLREQCDHNYVERELGLRCVKCGAERAFDGEDAEEWQRRSEEQGTE